MRKPIRISLVASIALVVCVGWAVSLTPGCQTPAGGGGGAGQDTTPAEPEVFEVPTGDAETITLTENAEGEFEGESAGEAGLGTPAPENTKSGTVSVSAANVHFPAGPEKQVAALEDVDRWATVTVHIAPAGDPVPCAEQFAVINFTATENADGEIRLDGQLTVEADLPRATRETAASDSFLFCIQVVANFPGTVVVDMVDIALAAGVADDANENGDDDDPPAGDAAAGQALYEANGCVVCHGDPGAGNGNGPDLAGESASDIEEELLEEHHPGGQFPDFIAEDYDNLAAFLDAAGDDDGDDDDDSDDDNENGDDDNENGADDDDDGDDDNENGDDDNENGDDDDDDDGDDDQANENGDDDVANENGDDDGENDNGDADGNDNSADNENDNADDGSTGGDATAGQTLYEVNGCALCHGDPGAGNGNGLDLAGESALDIEEELTDELHAGGPFPDFTAEDYANLAAFLAADNG